MIFPFEVKKNGIYYPAGTEVPTGANKGAEMPPSDVPGKVETKETPKEGRKYSEEDLNVNVFTLKSLAKQEGLSFSRNAKADEIREALRKI